MRILLEGSSLRILHLDPFAAPILVVLNAVKDLRRRLHRIVAGAAHRVAQPSSARMTPPFFVTITARSYCATMLPSTLWASHSFAM